MSWVYVAVGIACLIALQMLRAALSMVFPPYDARPARAPEASEFGGLDLIDLKTEALASLGFAGPAWVGNKEEVAAVSGVDAHAVYHNKDEHIVAWVGPTIEVTQPNQLLTYYSTLLQDGRYAVTQVSDPYFSIVNDPRTPAQTIGASDVRTEVAAHMNFVRELAVPPANSTPQEAVLRFAGEHLNSIRKRLLERGLIRESDGIARPSLGFAFRILKAVMTRPKPVAPPSLEVPTSRLDFLAGTVERQKERAPSQGMQWLLLLISGLLFVGIGWPLFGLELTTILLAVIVLHEGGHWLAMKLFGYGNPHITLLPLLGGVTIGHENDPSAGKRAWVALAGPLPGILLGWGLLATMMMSGNQQSFEGVALTAVVILLFVNYLNVLPIPPLDGHHVVQAILPPRWVVLQVVLIVIGVAAGVYVAYVLEFWPIAAISALQLFGIRSLWRTTQFVGEFSRNPVPAGVDRMTHRAWIFEALDQKLGKPRNAVRRIGLANGILHQLELQPMGWGQRTLVTGVYSALLVVPIAGFLLSAMVPWDSEPGDSDPEMAELWDELDQNYEALVAEAATLDVETLVSDLRGQQPEVPPASNTAIEDLRERMGSLPADLEALYRVRDGQLEGFAIAPVALVRPADPALFVTGDLQYSVYEGQIYFWHEAVGGSTLPRSATRNWWQLGHDEEWSSYVFFDPAAAPGKPSIYSFGVDETAAYLSIGEMLRERWVQDRYSEVYSESFAERRSLREYQLEDATVTELLDEFPKPGWVIRLVTGDLRGPGGATEGDLSALTARVGRPLPGDLVEAWSVSNGHAGAALLPTSSVRPGREAGELVVELAMEIVSATNTESIAPDFAACWIVGGWEAQGDVGAYASTFWCPDAPGAHRFVDLQTDSIAPDYRTVLRRKAAMQIL